jgi:hypothetical protein
MILYREPLKMVSFRNQTNDFLWKYLDKIGIDRSTIKGTGKNGRIHKSDLYFRIEEFDRKFVRVSVGSYKTDRMLWIDIERSIFEYGSLKKISENEIYEIYETDRVSPTAWSRRKLYDTTDYRWQNLGTTEGTIGLNKLRKAIIFLETRELYVKIKHFFIDCLLCGMDDVIQYCIHRYIETIGIDICSGIIVK